MRALRTVVVLLVVYLSAAGSSAAQDLLPSKTQSQNQDSASVQPVVSTASHGSFDQVVEQVVARERSFVAQLRRMHPLAETYIQNFKSDREAKAAPVSDRYFLGRLDMSNGPEDRLFKGESSFKQRVLGKFTNVYSMKFLPLGFAQMVMLDEDFQKKNYKFEFVRREFLGEVRCLVIDVQPKEHSGNGRFLGRIWVEDQDYNIVRFNGTYSPHPRYSYYFHFDSWRLNLQPGLWLPAYIYSAESDVKHQAEHGLQFKAQTRLWGYDLQHLGRNEEFTQIQVDSPQTVRDQSESAKDASPVEA